MSDDFSKAGFELSKSSAILYIFYRLTPGETLINIKILVEITI